MIRLTMNNIYGFNITYEEACNICNRLSKEKGKYFTIIEEAITRSNGFVNYPISNKYDPKYLRSKSDNHNGFKNGELPVTSAGINKGVSKLHVISTPSGNNEDYRKFKSFCTRDIKTNINNTYGSLYNKFHTPEAEEVFKNTYSRPGKTPYWVNLYYCIPIGMDEGCVITDRVDHTSEYYARSNIRTASTITYLKTVKIWR